ncbi:MAG: response regulator [Chloroflexi bacterium]|nr:response regulator [Chloroflexota bacterium]
MTPHILAVDDEPGWLTFAKEDLGKAFDVEIASDLETTLAILKKKSFDLIIASSRHLDILKTISEKYPEERVVVATGQPTTREAIDTYRLGALDYFAKDFRPEVISAKIHEAIQKPLKIST